MSSKKRPRSMEEISATPAAQAVRTAVRIIGGAAATGRLVQRSGQAVQKWTENPEKMDPEFARILCRATDYRVKVSEMLPDVYGDLTEQELGYLPKVMP